MLFTGKLYPESEDSIQVLITDGKRPAIELEACEQQAPDMMTAVQNRIRQVREHLSEVGTDIQALSHHLHSSKLEYLGLVVAAKGFCRELSEQHNVRIEFKDSAIPAAVPKEISLCIFRVLQEALRNAVRHSGGKTSQWKCTALRMESRC